jgi:hypothetical protein
VAVLMFYVHLFGVVILPDHNPQHVNVCKELRQIASSLSWVITGDESWIYGQSNNPPNGKVKNHEDRKS